MAKTKNKNYIVEQYVRYFGKAPTDAQIADYADLGKPKDILKQITGDANDAKPSNITYDDYIDSIFQNLFGRPASGPEKTKYAKTYDKKGVLPINAIVKAAKSSDKAVYQTKKAVALLIAEEGSTTNFDLDKITKDTYKLIYNPKTKKLSVDTVAQLETKIDAMPDNVSGETFNLTKGIDTFVGSDKGDVFNAVQAGADFVLGALDTIDGGAGVDTLNVQDTATAATASFSFGGATIKNVENINVATNGNFSGLDTTAITGLTSFTGKAAGVGATTLTVADTTDVTLTLGTTANSTVKGGKAVSVTKGDTSAGTLDITGKALTTVTVKDGTGVVTIDNLENSVAATTAKGTTLTSVILDSVDANAAIKGEGLTSVTLKGVTTAARTTTVTNAKADHEITVNVDGTGYDATAAEKQSVFVDANAKTITVNATGAKSSLSLAGSTSATTVNITGTADLTLLALASATKVNGSTATGGLTLGTLNAATVNVSTGSGKDSLTLSATTKVTVDTGAGNDTVTLASAVAAGSTINLGAGNDTLLVSATGSVLASTASAVTIIDGGEGIDTLAAALVNAANAAQFKNFDLIDLTNATTTALDVELMTASTITGLTLSTTATKGAATVTNVAAGVGLTISGIFTTNTAATTIGVKGAATGTADSFAITFAGTAATDATAAAPTKINDGTGAIVVNGVETLSISSTGTGFVSNKIVLTDDKLQTLTISGDKALDLSFTGTNGANIAAGGGAVNMIDGSAATGKLTINTTNVTADNKVGVGLTVKGGSADDFITLTQKATVDAGAGNDTIITSADGGTLTGGAGNDTFNVSAAIAVAGALTEATGAIKTTITDIAAGDKIILAASSGFTADKVALDSTVTNLDLALTLATSTASKTTWFQYANNTYIVVNDSNTGFGAADQVIKLSGLVDLSNAAYASGVTDTLTIA
ncbi:beta strand repeat-containing protein [Aliarcobacter cryaerophilus]|uniref:beta strand repeat-containing protein n=1 Tax=Aliarcobacter cryaerophilus TaxID=28198 RepID=UPI0021B4E7C0|nr:hypothetical protein [Aliarcobacter cryaerophilus]MCT7529999.1 hypothetical protein [Aliarcobacter cryaerophilus]